MSNPISSTYKDRAAHISGVFSNTNSLFGFRPRAFLQPPAPEPKKPAAAAAAPAHPDRLRGLPRGPALSLSSSLIGSLPDDRSVPAKKREYCDAVRDGDHYIYQLAGSTTMFDRGDKIDVHAAQRYWRKYLSNTPPDLEFWPCPLCSRQLEIKERRALTHFSKHNWKAGETCVDAAQSRGISTSSFYSSTPPAEPVSLGKSNRGRKTKSSDEFIVLSDSEDGSSQPMATDEADGSIDHDSGRRNDDDDSDEDSCVVRCDRVDIGLFSARCASVVTVRQDLVTVSIHTYQVSFRVSAIESVTQNARHRSLVIQLRRRSSYQVKSNLSVDPPCICQHDSFANSFLEIAEEPEKRQVRLYWHDASSSDWELAVATIVSKLQTTVSDGCVTRSPQLVDLVRAWADMNTEPASTRLRKKTDTARRLLSGGDHDESLPVMRTRPVHAAVDLKVLEFPADAKDSVILNSEDVNRLQPDQFLNDNLIDFWIKYLFLRRYPEAAARFYCFNSFFWAKITQTPDGRGVAKWTQSVNIFEKEFVLIPVCKSAHWTLVVVRMTAPREILWLDSLGGTGGGSFERIRNYLRSEYAAKVTPETDDDPITKDSFPCCNPTVPRQTNLSDCGLYLLQFIEALIEHTDAIASRPSCASKSPLFDDDAEQVIVANASQKRREILDTIQQLRVEQGRDPYPIPSDFHDQPSLEILSPDKSPAGDADYQPVRTSSRRRQPAAETLRITRSRASNLFGPESIELSPPSSSASLTRSKARQTQLDLIMSSDQTPPSVSLASAAAAARIINDDVVVDDDGDNKDKDEQEKKSGGGGGGDDDDALSVEEVQSRPVRRGATNNSPPTVRQSGRLRSNNGALIVRASPRKRPTPEGGQPSMDAYIVADAQATPADIQIVVDEGPPAKRSCTGDFTRAFDDSDQ